MFNFLKKSSGPSRIDLMTAVVTRNQLVQETTTTTGLRLTAPAKSHRLQSLTRSPRQKHFDLDDLGSSVWQSINNTRTVEDLIRHFAHEKTVNLREAEVAVTTFLKTLAQRNLIALVAPSK